MTPSRLGWTDMLLEWLAALRRTDAAPREATPERAARDDHVPNDLPPPWFLT